MGREIKFRAWDKEDKRMITHEQDFIPLKVTSIGVLRLDPLIKENRWELVDSDRFELMQYTGLKDKNGKDIYEGDILKVDFNGTEFLCVVVWLKGLCSFQVIQYIDGKKEYDDLNTVYSKRCEIIGNIYENPELLK